MTTYSFDRPEHVTADFVGVPGSRTFLVQVEDDEQRLAVVLEKQQVAAIAEAVTEMLDRLDLVPAIHWDEASMKLREPLEERFRAGGLSIGLDAEARTMALTFEEILADDEDGAPDELVITIDAEQARRLAAHAAEIIGKGLPKVDPSTNGHGPAVR